MKKKYLFIALFSVALFSCGNDEDGMTYAQPIEVGETTQMKAAKEIAEELWATSPLQQQPLDEARTSVFDKIQKLADDCSSDFFESYISALDQSAEMREKYDPTCSLPSVARPCVECCQDHNRREWHYLYLATLQYGVHRKNSYHLFWCRH